MAVRGFAADIGGTNARVGALTVEVGACTVDAFANLPSDGLTDGASLLDAMEAALRLPLKGDILAIALAGPVEGGRGRLTNGRLELEVASINRPDIGRVLLLNDFTAQAHACIHHAQDPSLRIPRKGVASCAILGAGTGLGMASMHRDEAGAWTVTASEAGHAYFPFLGDEEDGYRRFCSERLRIPAPSAEDVLSGRGLVRLHMFLTGKERTPAEIGESSLGTESETLAWYARFYGRICRVWMLTTLCRDGLWIAGGIARRNPLVVRCEHFLAELGRSGPWEEFVAGCPRHLVESDEAGLVGAFWAGVSSMSPSGPGPGHGA
ncbi:MAG: glucokinase [Desulfovibrio sp.]|jgi:glucokinase|nr:glucokinase [Desulfovibrio sp.]